MNGQTSLPQPLAILPVLQARFEDLVERLIEREMWDQPSHDLGHSWGKALTLHGLAGTGCHLATVRTNSGKTPYELSNLSLFTHKKSFSSAHIHLQGNRYAGVSSQMLHRTTRWSVSDRGAR